jgi:hypothetical protein
MNDTTNGDSVMFLTMYRRCRRARLTLGNARYQIAPQSFPGGAITYWGCVLAMAVCAAVSFGAVLG